MQAEDVGGSTSMRRSARQRKCTYAMEEEDAVYDDDEDYDPGLLVDSDNEIGNDDDDLYADNIDEDEPEQRQENKSNERAKHKGDQVQPKAQDKGKQKYDSDEDLCEGENLWAPDSDDEELHLKFRTFRPADGNGRMPGQDSRGGRARERHDRQSLRGTAPERRWWPSRATEAE
ncbi:hypothetical protein ZWY2020_043485 [Hordeum vulgare]|nr:hypothetical protein ZWY2020_043485 [Hordeum vulgare]